MNPLIVFRVGYMERYDGPDKITGGGAHIEKYEEGGEMWNFQPDIGRCYGYVMTRHFAGIDLQRIDRSSARGRWQIDDELRGVDIVFIAKQPSGRQVVIGWYKDATVFHKVYRKRLSPLSNNKSDKLDYLCEVDATNVFLLPEVNRTKFVKYAPSHGKGYPGHSNLWYGDQPEAKKCIDDLRRYIYRTVKVSGVRVEEKLKGGGFKRLDKKTILEIEKMSMAAVMRHFEKEGYSVTPVHRECCGWDLSAQKGKTTLQLEVKGHLGDVVRFELTPNEYSMMQIYSNTYRVCLVRRALESKVVEVFIPRRRAGKWQLADKLEGSVLALGEATAARASEIS